MIADFAIAWYALGWAVRGIEFWSEGRYSASPTPACIIVGPCYLFVLLVRLIMWIIEECYDVREQYLWSKKP